MGIGDFRGVLFDDLHRLFQGVARDASQREPRLRHRGTRRSPSLEESLGSILAAGAGPGNAKGRRDAAGKE